MKKGMKDVGLPMEGMLNGMARTSYKMAKTFGPKPKKRR
jgi:hypothetical protein